jgi:hypothetical protein
MKISKRSLDDVFFRKNRCFYYEGDTNKIYELIRIVPCLYHHNKCNSMKYSIKQFDTYRCIYDLGTLLSKCPLKYFDAHNQNICIEVSDLEGLLNIQIRNEISNISLIKGIII